MLAALVLAGCAAAVLTVLSTSTMGDYNVHAGVGGDNPAPAIDALIHGDLSSFIARQPLMGLTSILLRLPAAALAAVVHAGPIGAYRWGAVVCLLPAGVLSGWMVHQAGPGTMSCIAALAAAALVLVSRAASEAVGVGHPEEILASVLATGAVLAAIRRHHSSAAVLLGLAIGTKQWALVAVAPVLLAPGHQRLRTAAVASGVGLLLTVAAPLADPGAFAQAGAAVGSGHLTNPFSFWWLLGTGLPHAAGAFIPTAHRLPLGLTRSTATAIALAVAVSMLVLIHLRRRARGRAIDPLALLALLGLLRCVADPAPIQYYFLAFLIPLAAWEAVSLRRLPVTAYLATGAVWLTAGGAIHAAPPVLSVLSAAWALALGAYLVDRAFNPPARDVVLNPGAIAPDHDLVLMARC